MDASRANALMNLAAGVLVFGAAIAPMVITIFKRAKAADKTDVLMAMFLSILALVLVISGAVSWYCYRSPAFTLLFVGGGAFADVAGFGIQNSPPTRQDIARHTFTLLSVTLFLLVIAFQISSQPFNAKQP